MVLYYFLSKYSGKEFIMRLHMDKSLIRAAENYLGKEKATVILAEPQVPVMKLKSIQILSQWV